MLHAKNRHICINGVETDYLVFGQGSRDLLLLSGVGDGLRTAKGMALPMAWMYRCFAKDFRVWYISRRNNLPEGFTTAQMADDIDDIMDAEGILRADVIGVSQGGMIAQQLALRHPERIGDLVLAVTAARPNDTMRSALLTWKMLAGERNYRGIMLNTCQRSYTGAYYRKSLKTYDILSRFTAPKDFTRFEILLDACLMHDVYAQLSGIGARTLIIGGGRDAVVSGEASRELAAGIKGSRLYMYPHLSHGLYEQAPDFNARVLEWLTRR